MRLIPPPSGHYSACATYHPYKAGPSMAPERLSRRCYRCRFCGLLLPAWLPVFQAPNGAMRLGHLKGRHARATAG
jgi:hypothetical protein